MEPIDPRTRHHGQLKNGLRRQNCNQLVGFIVDLLDALPFSAAVSPPTNPAVAIAPALIIGLSGAPLWGSRLIESLAARLDTDLAKNVFAPWVCERSGVQGGLGDRLHGEGRITFPDRVGVTVGRDNAYAESIGVGFGELGNVGFAGAAPATTTRHTMH
jgi:hypothetical protein